MVIYSVSSLAVILDENLHLYRQLLGTAASCLLSITVGITLGSSAVLLPQLKEDPHFSYDPDLDSWIASISPFAMMFGSIISGPSSDAIGRKLGQLLLIIPFSIGWLAISFAPNTTYILLGRFIIGLSTGSVRAVSMVYVGEISDPKHRPVTLFCPTFATFIGVLISHTVVDIHWRLSSLLFIIPILVCFVLLMFLKESPLWLLSKGRIEAGIESFIWFRGEGQAAKEELKLILDSRDNSEPFQDFRDIVLSKSFAKSIINVLFLFIAVQFCGVNTLSFYAQDIFKTTFKGRVDPFMFMIVSDLIRVITVGCVCLFAKKLPRRVTFLSTCYGTVLMLLSLVVYLYFDPVGLVWVGITCLVLYLGVAGVFTCIPWSIVAEIFPSRIRGLGSGIGSLISFGLLFISVKFAPGLRERFGDSALYGSFAIITLLSAVVLTFTLPETHGKSLQSIENNLYSRKDNSAPRQTNITPCCF